MPQEVKSRQYNSTRRREAASTTRSVILHSARELFIDKGYAGTTMGEIARRASVAPDTIYASIGTKPSLFRHLIEAALSGQDHAVDGAQRDYARDMRDAPAAGEKLAIYADAVTAIQKRLAPLFLALRAARSAHPELEVLWEEITARRAQNMRALAADLASTGELRDDLSTNEVADVIWTMNSSEYYAMLVIDRGWSTERFRMWLLDSWRRLLLAAATSRLTR